MKEFYLTHSAFGYLVNVKFLLVLLAVIHEGTPKRIVIISQKGSFLEVRHVISEAEEISLISFHLLTAFDSSPERVLHHLVSITQVFARIHSFSVITIRAKSELRESLLLHSVIINAISKELICGYLRVVRKIITANHLTLGGSHQTI